MEIVCISSKPDDLGESLFWDHEEGRLYWIDAWRTTIRAFVPERGTIATFDLSAALAGFPIGSLARCREGGMVAGVKGGFYRLDLDRCAAELISPAEVDRPATNRLNDGKCDRAGRFWCASVNTDHRTPSGALWKLEGGGRDPVRMADGLVAGNGIAWSPDDRFMYLADTFVHTIWRYPFDLATGGLGEREVFASTAGLGGGPDGATVDADGCYWSALFRAGVVGQFDPDGTLIRTVVLPVSTPTICAFGGRDLDILFVASASRFHDEAQRRAEPLAGRLFAIHGLGTKGLPEPSFRP